MASKIKEYERRHFRDTAHGKKSNLSMTEKQLARYALKGEMPNIPVELERRPNVTGVHRTCERVTGDKLPVETKTYMYHPTRCVRMNKVNSFSGSSASQWDVDTKKPEKNVIVLADTVYNYKPAREAIYAHEYAESIKEMHGASEKESHEYGVKAENAVARKYGMTRADLLRKTRADFKEAHGCSTPAKKHKKLGSLFKQQIKQKQYY